MDTQVKPTTVSVGVTVKASLPEVWKCWTEPQHIVRWNFASDDWHSPEAENDLKEGGKFCFRMEAKDGSAGFDFDGIYKQVEEHRLIAYTIADGRKVEIHFTPNEKGTTINETFEAETTHSVEVQKAGWQAILENFKKYIESGILGEKLYFEALIEASPKKVYNRMLEKNTYQEWTSVFHPTSHYEGSWEKGAKILFLACDEKGVAAGMFSRIRENIPLHFVSIEHLGLYQDGQEITEGVEVANWAGALENYTFTASDGHTILSVDVDINKEFKDHFNEAWPKALQKLKEICEDKSLTKKSDFNSKS